MFNKIMISAVTATIMFTGCTGETLVETMKVKKNVTVRIPTPLPTPALIFLFSEPYAQRVVIHRQIKTLISMMTIVENNKDQCYELNGFVVGNNERAKNLMPLRFSEIETPDTPEMTLEQYSAFTELHLPSYYTPICLVPDDIYKVRAGHKT